MKTIGLIYAKDGDFKKAFDYTEKAIALCKSIGARANLEECYENLAHIYELKKDFKSSVEFLKKAYVLKGDHC